MRCTLEVVQVPLEEQRPTPSTGTSSGRLARTSAPPSVASADPPVPVVIFPIAFAARAQGPLPHVSPAPAARGRVGPARTIYIYIYSH